MSTQTNTTTTTQTSTSTGANTMTNSTITTVQTLHPELYADHTYHMQRAMNYTYNYVVIDTVLLENYADMTVNEIAQAMNEYKHRITYRVQVLQALGLIKAKRNTGKMQLLKTKRMLEADLKDVNAELDKLVA